MSNQPDDVLDKILLKYSSNVANEVFEQEGHTGSTMPKFTLGHTRAAIKALLAEQVREAIEITWDSTGEGYNGEYTGLTHTGGKRYTDDEVMQKVVADVLSELQKPTNPKIV